MPQLRQLIRKQGRHARIVVGSMALCAVLGGGGIAHPITELVTQLALAALAVAWVWFTPRSAFAQIPLAAWVVAGLVVLLPLVQLVPLPPALWQSLPGRAPELAALKLAGLEHSWRPLALFPDLTLACALSMACAMLLVLMTASLTSTARTLVLMVVAGVALLSVVVGAGQVGGGDGAGNIFRFYNPDYPFLLGFQNNRNAQADVLLIGMVCLAFGMPDMVLAGVLPARRRLVLAAVAIGSLVLALGVVLTGSRTGMALLVPVVLAQAILLLPWLGMGPRNLALLALAGGVLGGLAVYLLRDNAMIGRALHRFATQGEFRPEIWTDTLYAIRTYLPWGTGMGSFLPVFMITERLEIVDFMVVNRAHNDYLELALEAGIPGLLLAALVAGLMLRGVWRGLRSGNARLRGQVLCATSVQLIIGAHSLLDYPLRSLALAGIAGAALGIILNPNGIRAARDD